MCNYGRDCIQGVGDMVQLLSVKLKDATTPQLAAIEAIRQVLLLQAENAACTHDMQPFNLYITARVRGFSIHTSLHSVLIPPWASKQGCFLESLRADDSMSLLCMQCSSTHFLHKALCVSVASMLQIH